MIWLKLAQKVLRSLEGLLVLVALTEVQLVSVGGLWLSVTGLLGESRPLEVFWEFHHFCISVCTYLGSELSDSFCYAIKIIFSLNFPSKLNQNTTCCPHQLLKYDRTSK